MIHHTAEVEEGASIGEGTKVWHYCHIRKGAKIGANCSLGRNVFIDADVTIGDGTRIQNNVSIYRGVEIQHRCFIGPHVVFTNDKRPRAYPVDGGWDLVPTLIKHHASLGAGCVVVCGIVVGAFAMAGAGSVVCRDLQDYELVIEYSKHAGYIDYNGRLRC